MAEDAKDTVRKVRKRIGDVVKSTPLLTITKAISDVGEHVIEHTPKKVRKVGRQLRGEAADALEALPGLTRRIGRSIRKAAKTTRKTTRKLSRGRRSNASRR